MAFSHFVGFVNLSNVFSFCFCFCFSSFGECWVGRSEPMLAQDREQKDRRNNEKEAKDIKLSFLRF